jgi:hypothetical protein
MAAPVRRIKEDPADRLTPTERSRYKEAADLILSWLDEDPTYDRKVCKELNRRLPELRTRVHEGNSRR